MIGSDEFGASFGEDAVEFGFEPVVSHFVVFVGRSGRWFGGSVSIVRT